MYQWSGSAWVASVTLILAIVDPQGSGSVTYESNIGIGLMDLVGRTVVPAGTIHTFAGTVANVPAGYLLANGSAISRTTFRHLFNAIGTTYGVGNGTTTFNIPDLRGEFLRGLDNGRGIDTGRALGSAQADEFEAHTHVQQYTASSGADDGYAIDGSNNPASQIATSVITGSTGGTETRPRNIAMNFIIKF
jgi:microcystin-dependent protein